MIWLPDNFVSTCFYACQNNEWVAIVARHAVELPPADDALIGKVRKYYHGRYCVPAIQPMSWEELIADVSQSRRKRVTMAYDENKLGYQKRWEKVKAFVKFEKWPAYTLDGTSEDLRNKAARLIQFRRPEFTYNLARYLRPIEHYIFSHDETGRWLKLHQRTFAKGMTSWQVANNLYRKSQQFAHPIYIMCDYSKMDAHLRLKMREMLEWSFYRRFNPDVEFRRLLRVQEHNIVESIAGTKWKIDGTMMSGEYNTSLGDSLINDELMSYWLRDVKHAKLINGDDGVMIVEAEDISKLDMDFFLKVGMKLKVELESEFSRVSFCQCSPCFIFGSWRMVRNPYRVMSRAAYTTKNLNGRGWLKLLGSIGMGELACNGGFPVLQAYSQMLIRSANGQFSQALFDDYMDMRVDKTSKHALPVTAAARRSFQESFGISIGQQLDLEQCFDRTILPVLPK